MEQRYTIGDLAREVGIATSAIRYYEQRRLLRPDGRTEGNFRVYGPATLERLRFIRAAQAIGFTLDDIASLLDFADGSQSPCKRVQTLLQARLKDVHERMEQLRDVETVLTPLLRKCRLTERSGRCHVIDRLKRSASPTPSPARSASRKSRISP